MVRISIAMATYNGESFIEEQLESLRAQTHSPLELHVGDDGSTDATEDIVRRFARDAPFPVHFTKNATRLGFGENFVQTALRCSGEWIAFCDQDDVWSPDKLQWAAQRVQKGPSDLMLLAHNATIVDRSLRGHRPLYNYPKGETLTGRLGLPPEWYCTGFTQVFRADLVRSIPSNRRVSFPWHSHRNAHDVWIALLANCTGSVLRNSSELALYRRHDSTATDQATGSDRPPFERTGTGYRERAAYLHEVAATLRSCVPGAPADLASMLEEATDRIEDHSQVLQLRFRAYSGKNLPDRLRTILELIGDGAYLGRSPWRFGGARLLKDSLCALRII
jgi:glycosyltransferase involved in cell wall biosynthesis